MGDVYDKIIIGDKSYDFVKGVQNFKDQLYTYFPNDTKAIDGYVDLVFAASKTSQKYYMDKAFSDGLHLFSFGNRPELVESLSR